MFNIKNLSVSINNKNILKNINFNIKKGERHALIGPNGSGKTTLVNALAGKKEYTTSGSIELQKNELSSLIASNGISYLNLNQNIVNENMFRASLKSFSATHGEVWHNRKYIFIPYMNYLIPIYSFLPV